MDLPEDVLGNSESVTDVAPGVFNMTITSFESEAINLKRGLRARQTLNSLRTLVQLNHELRSQSKSSYKAIIFQATKQHE